MDKKEILVVDNSEDMCWLVSNLLEAEGFIVDIAVSGMEALDKIRRTIPDVVVLDIRMRKMDGWEVLENIKKLGKPVSVIIMTAYGDIKSAVRAMKMGAYDFLTKPFDNDEMVLTVKRAVENIALRKEMQVLKRKLEGELSLESIMGTSPEVKKVIHKIDHVAPTDMSVIILGETGTGKELIARTIHKRSRRNEGPFIAVDCGAIPDTLMESEFFGFEKGAFTGAEGKRIGYFESAERGTLFLDEINNLPTFLQGKLLRVLQEREVRRLGADKSKKVDIRVVTASSKSLEREAREGNFREDLLYRLNEFTINLPTLKERGEDILFLAKLFLDEAKSEFQKETSGFTEEAVRSLLYYTWPGNVRELRNAIRRAVLLNPKMIATTHLFEQEEKTKPAGKDSDSLDNIYSLSEITKRTVKKAEVEAIKKALRSTGGNKSKAAELLNIDYKTLFRKIKRYDIHDLPF